MRTTDGLAAELFELAVLIQGGFRFRSRTALETILARVGEAHPLSSDLKRAVERLLAHDPLGASDILFYECLPRLTNSVS